MPEVEKWARITVETVRCHSRVATFAHSLAAPLITTRIAICLLVNQHPSHVGDCPCFEDAISFVSVFLGIKYQCRPLVLEARACAEYLAVHLRHSWYIARLLHHNPDLGAVRSVEARDGDSDRILMMHPERADPAATALPMACLGKPRAPAAPSSQHARDGICERPATHCGR